VRAIRTTLIERAIHRFDSSIAARNGPTNAFACGTIHSVET
jgi:hypothetical protein